MKFLEWLQQTTITNRCSLEDAAAGAGTVKETVEETADLRAASMRFQSSGSRCYSGVSPEFVNIGRVWKEDAYSKSTRVGLGCLWEGRAGCLGHPEHCQYCFGCWNAGL